MEVKKQYAFLLIGGDQNCRAELAALLTDAGYIIEQVADADEALAQCVKKPYALILVDLFIPGELNGVALIEQIRKMHYKSGIIAFSDQSGKKITEDALQAGADRYLSRESIRKEILSVVSSMIPGLTVDRPRTATPIPLPREIESQPLQEEVPQFFAYLPASDVQTLLSQARGKELLPGQILALDGNREMAIMAEGEADLLYKGKCVGRLRKNDAIGEASLFLHDLHEHSFTLAARSKGMVWVLDKTVIKKYLKDHDRSVTLRFVVNIIKSVSCRLFYTLDEYSRLLNEVEEETVKKDSINRLSEIINN